MFRYHGPTRFLVAALVAAITSGCSGDEPEPSANVELKFCTDLTLDDEDAEFYIELTSEGIDERLTAMTSSCSGCVELKANTEVHWTWGYADSELGTGTFTPNAGEHYFAAAKLGDDGNPACVVYELLDEVRQQGTDCSNADPFE